LKVKVDYQEDEEGRKQGEEVGWIRKCNRGDEYDQNTLYAWMEMPWWNPSLCTI
jgi:hypothetical protein